MELKDKKVLIFGSGISGIGAARLLGEVGASLVIYDGNQKLTREDIARKLPAGVSARIVIGALPDEVIAGIDLAVLSPGVPTDIDPVLRIRAANKPIWGEVELASVCGQGDILAITGTNGKTTTTTLVGEIMKYHVSRGTHPRNDQVFVVGNIGTPYTGAALSMTPATVSVAEISSFQLETIDTFHPKVSAITNITPDHLDRHHTMKEYIRVKERITRNQTADETCVLNYEDPILRAFGEQLHTRVLFFSAKRPLQKGLFLQEDQIMLREEGKTRRLFSVEELALLGEHNYENVMTAIGVTYAYGVPLEEICHVVLRFTAVEHRIEYVAEKKGVVFYNDSKGTNPDAAIKGICAMRRPTVLIGGGYDKGASYEEWIRCFPGRVTTLVLVGQTKDKIYAQAKQMGFTQVVLADTFEEAFAASVAAARPGDAVLLSPACASWGMFPNYEVRGKVFKELVAALPDA